MWCSLFHVHILSVPMMTKTDLIFLSGTSCIIGGCQILNCPSVKVTMEFWVERWWLCPFFIYLFFDQKGTALCYVSMETLHCLVHFWNHLCLVRKKYKSFGLCSLFFLYSGGNLSVFFQQDWSHVSTQNVSRTALSWNSLILFFYLGRKFQECGGVLIQTFILSEDLKVLFLLGRLFPC